MLPNIVGALVDASVSINRLYGFIMSEELDPMAVDRLPAPDEPDGKPAVEIRGATFAWAKNGQPILKNISASLENGGLLFVVGRVGAGKSSLLSAILGEMDKVSGSVTVRGN